jgi:uncharacterized protein (DUF2236 family)
MDRWRKIRPDTLGWRIQRDVVSKLVPGMSRALHPAHPSFGNAIAIERQRVQGLRQVCRGQPRRSYVCDVIHRQIECTQPQFSLRQ